MSKQWRRVPLSEALRRSEETITLKPESKYQQITVKLWGKGVVLRGILTGAEIAAVRQIVAHKGQFILSRIDARNGAFGIVPQELDGAVVSNDFPVFDIQADRLVPAYLGWMCRTDAFIVMCQRASEGTTNRVRLQEDKFLAQDVMLPSVNEQQRIVERIEDLAAKVEEARRLREETSQQADNCIVSTHLHFARNRMKKLHELLILDEDQVEVIAAEKYPQVGLRGFGGGLFSKATISGNETTYRRFNRLYEGAVVLSQVKGWEGAITVCGSDFNGRFASPEYRTFRCIASEARPNYLAALMATEWFWNRLRDATRGVGARRERTRPEQFLSIEIPMPTVQQQIEGESIFGQIHAVQNLHRETAAELDALMPSILDKAFRGAL